MARRQIDQACIPGSSWLGHCMVGDENEYLCPYLTALETYNPSPVNISPMVRSLRYFLHLLSVINSRFLKEPFRNSSMMKISLFDECVR